MERITHLDLRPLSEELDRRAHRGDGKDLDGFGEDGASNDDVGPELTDMHPRDTPFERCRRTDVASISSGRRGGNELGRVRAGHESTAVSRCRAWRPTTAAYRRGTGGPPTARLPRLGASAGEHERGIS